MKLPITCIILTFNEENNIENCLKSVFHLCDEIMIVDSGSTDKTIEIAKNYTDCIFYHEFENYASQRNWALDNLPIHNNWIFNLDADHRITEELETELLRLFQEGIPDEVSGFLISRRTIFLGRWIRYGGHYPTYHSCLFKKGFGRCEDKLYDQHFVVTGKLIKVKGDIEDIITDSISRFIARHNQWSTLEARFITEKQKSRKNHELIRGNPAGNPIEKRRAFRDLYYCFPLFLRPFVYFFYRYVIRLGFLDGKEGLIFHVLQGFWFRFLVDVKIWELRRSSSGLE
ncbi:glycosyltransferase family 2 protein [Thermoflavifilum thermophilum]|uniref:Glycosyltransferase involved in cell wall bisynthesis n=1 Tax=Thermoflavifilum thermophilum TaxID=1393122 RepID=A0A1I7N9T6_9BACT|nr:glycosyltransferase family 2 protein [Thermoflavifilum thermophilum]SFV31343.1 Glycosyltransferase involved in cell wall bisynthesis [Thermoflavifilum thermophilum]